MEIISPKEFRNLVDKVNKIEQQSNLLKSLPKSVQNLTDKITKVEEKLNLMNDLPSDVHVLKEKVNNLENEVTKLGNENLYNREQIEEKIKIQEEIIMDMIHKFNEEFFKHKTEVVNDIEILKTQQDVLRISYTVNESKLVDKVKDLITEELKNRIRGQEGEILMKMWIDEFKEITKGFEKLKKLKPKEFNLKLNELLSTIKEFKQKIDSF
ncbi:MAG: hypothetical protein ACFFGP_04700 [Promethearchaeota archaeon]